MDDSSTANAGKADRRIPLGMDLFDQLVGIQSGWEYLRVGRRHQ